MLTRTLSLAIPLALALPLAAQSPGRPAPKPLPVMRGAVQDLDGAPLEGAEVELLGADRKATTGGNGAYRLQEIAPGRYWVVARRIGYAPVRAALTFGRGDDREIVFQLEPVPQRIADLEVRAEDLAWQRKYEAFTWRSRAGFGRFLTRDDIERGNPSYLGDVVRRYLPWVSGEQFFHAADHFTGRAGEWGTSGLLGWVGTQSAGSAARRNCPPAVSVNGSSSTGFWGVNDFRPDEVEALEIYRRTSSLPPEFARMNGASCGLVVVWLR